MSATLTSMLARVRVVLMSATGTSLPWDDAALTESIRQALGEHQLAGSAAVTLAGLDGATETSLPPLHGSLIVWGAAGYAAVSRAVIRAESFQFGSEAMLLKAWGEARLGEFKAMLSAAYPSYRPGQSPGSDAAEAQRLADLRMSANASWGTWEEAA